MKNIHIAIYIHNFKRGGAECVFLELTNYLANNGYVVDLVLDNAIGGLIEELEPTVRIVDLGVSNIKLSSFKLLKYVISNKPDIILSTLKENNVNALLATSIARWCGVKNIVREANTLSQEMAVEKSKVNKFKHYLIKKLYPRASRIIVLSEHMAKDLLMVVPSANKVGVIYNPINFDKIKFLASCVNVSHNKKHTIVMASRLTIIKGHLDFIDAVFELKKIRSDFKCIIMGDGEDRDEIIKYCHAKGVHDFIDYVGHVDNPFPYIDKASCFVQASYFEGMPNGVLQALALEVPVISTDSPGAIREIKNISGNVALVSLGDPKEMAISICRVIDGRLTETTNHKQFVDSFALEHVMRKYEETIEEVYYEKN